MKMPQLGGGWKFFLAAGLCFVVYLIHFAVLLKNAVNIPFYDEWEAVRPDGFLASPGFSELFAQHNEHRIVTTKILTLLLYKLNGWNLVTHQAVNFIIYGLLLALLVWFVKKNAPRLPGWGVVAFLVFLLSARNVENHFWGFQTQFHFSLLFLFSGTLLLFNEKQEWLKIAGGVFFSWLTVFSLSSGVAESLVVLLGYSLFKFLRIRQSSDRRREVFQFFFVAAGIGAALGLYFVDYHRPDGHPELALPFQRDFWFYFLNLLSGGFGYLSLSIKPGLLFLFFLLVPVAGEILKRGRSMPSGTWAVAVSILSVLAALAAISLGRAGFGAEQAKSSRYAELIGVLIPLSAAMWAIFLSERARARNSLLIAFWLFCFFGLSDSWNFSKQYNDFAGGRRTGLRCVRDYYRGSGDGNCPSIYPAPIPDRLESARKLELSFAEEAAAAVAEGQK